MRKSFAITAVSLGIMCNLAQAELEPVILTVTTMTPITVPSDKVLVVESMGLIPADVRTGQAPITMYFSKNGVTNGVDAQQYLSTDVGGSQTVKYPWVIPSGTTISITAGGTNPNWGYTFFGMYASPADLYVQVEHEINSLDPLAGLMMNMGLRASTARPTRFQIEKADTLQAANWEPAAAKITPTTDGRQYFAEVDGSDPLLYLRSKARPRN